MNSKWYIYVESTKEREREIEGGERLWQWQCIVAFWRRLPTKLPHLYDNLLGSDINCTKAGRREFFLREGDLLYIPRGFPHEAYTSSAVSDGSPGFSFHLTLSIEVEPPFE